MIRNLALAAVLAAAPAVRADDKPAAKDRPDAIVLPKKVTDAVLAKFPKAEILRAKKATDEGKHYEAKDYYCVEVRHDAKLEKVDVTEAGEILGTHAPVAKTELPKAVKDTIAKDHPKAECKDVDAYHKKDKTYYEVEIVADGKSWIYTYDDAGKEVFKRESRESKAAK